MNNFGHMFHSWGGVYSGKMPQRVIPGQSTKTYVIYCQNPLHRGHTILDPHQQCVKSVSFPVA